jgi:hypothetical protein
MRRVGRISKGTSVLDTARPPVRRLTSPGTQRWRTASPLCLKSTYQRGHPTQPAFLRERSPYWKPCKRNTKKLERDALLSSPQILMAGLHHKSRASLSVTNSKVASLLGTELDGQAYSSTAYGMSILTLPVSSGCPALLYTRRQAAFDSQRRCC